MRKTILILIFSFNFLLSIKGVCQDIHDVKINIQLKNASLHEAFRQIEQQSVFKFLANAEDIEKENNVTINVSNVSIANILERILSGRGLEYKQVDKNIFIKKTSAQSQRGSIKNQNERQSRYSIRGTVKSSKNGEVIIAATIEVAGSSVSTMSNEYGFYSLTLFTGNYTLQVSAIGMKSVQLPISLNKDLTLDISMDTESRELQTVTVVASPASRNLRNAQTSIERINVDEVKNVPVLFGERDILKTIQLLPGVKSAGEGNSGFYVRGGASDQNLILLDEAPVYNASHLLGFFSTFNSDALKNVTLYKGAMPAQYGGRLSSVVDIKMNDGNKKDLAVSGGIGLIASRLNIEGPIQKDKSSFLVSARRTYADVFLKLMGDSSLKKTRLYFYDLNAKMNFIVDEKNQVYLSGYFGRDVLSQQSLSGINWGNATGTLRWNHIFNKKIFSNTSFIISNYDYKISVASEARQYGIFSRIRDYNFKEELQFYADSKNTLLFGFNSIYHTIKPGEISVIGSNGPKDQSLQDRYSLENSIFASNNWRLHENWVINYGFRISAFSILGKGDYYSMDEQGRITDTTHYKTGEVVKTYLNVEPRLSASYQVNNTSSLKISYTRNTQNLHLVSNSTSSSPTDKWVASSNIIKPEIADQVAIGYYKNLAGARYELTLESYYKNLQHQIDYRNGAQLFTNEAIETQLLFGRGRAYGMEFMLRKRAGRLSGWISYTLSKTERKIEGINNGKWYNARQDRPHDIAIVAMYQLNPKWTLSANWVYYTGEAITYPTGKYRVDDEVYFYYSERNGYRMPDYHRLDVGATKQLKRGKRFSSELNFSIYNAYGRSNAYQITFRESELDPNKTEAVKTSLFTFVPSISYNFKF